MHLNGCVWHCSKQQYARDVSVSPHPPSILYNLATQIVLSILACRKERGKLTTSAAATCIVFEQSGWIATPCVDMQTPTAMALAAYAEPWSHHRTGFGQCVSSERWMKTRCSATIDQQASYLSKTTVGSVGALLLELGMEIVHFSSDVRWLEL